MLVVADDRLDGEIVVRIEERQIFDEKQRDDIVAIARIDGSTNRTNKATDIRPTRAYIRV